MTRKEEKFFKLLDELIQDESRYPATDEYVNKAEKLLQLYSDLYIKPILKGNDKMFKYKFDKNKQNVDIDKGVVLGEASVDNGNIVINLGLLKDVKPGLDYQKRRNQMLFSLLGSLPHEARHYFQVRCRKLIEKCDFNDKRVGFYQNMLGPDAEDIAMSTENGLTNVQLEQFVAILKVINPDLANDMDSLVEVMKEGSCLYYASAHEVDARKAEMEAKEALLAKITARIEQKFDAYRMPDKFEELTDMMGKTFSFGERKKKKRKEDDLLGDMLDFVDDMEKMVKNSKKGRGQITRKTNNLLDQINDMTQSFLKQQETFMSGLDSISEDISRELILESSHVVAVEQLVDLMKSFSGKEMTLYARAISGQSDRELLFSYALQVLVSNRYSQQFFFDKERVAKAGQLMLDNGLGWAYDILDKCFHIDGSYSENE